MEPGSAGFTVHVGASVITRRKRVREGSGWSQLDANENVIRLLNCQQVGVGVD